MPSPPLGDLRTLGQTYQPGERKGRERKDQGAEKLNTCKRRQVESETAVTGSMTVKRYSKHRCVQLESQRVSRKRNMN